MLQLYVLQRGAPYVYLSFNNAIHESLTQSVEWTISPFPRIYDNEMVICIANTTTEAYDSLNVTAQIRVTRKYYKINFAFVK
jgi:hypothetical protein